MRHLLRFGILIVLVVADLTAVGVDQTPPAAPTGLIFGRVVEATSGTPVRGAMVSLAGGRPGSMHGDRLHGMDTGPGSRHITVLTDSDGQFLFSSLAAGSYSLSVAKPGYAGGSFGQLRPGVSDSHGATGEGDRLTLRDGERRGDVTLRVWQHAAITGTVLDEFGEPIVGIGVRAFRRVIVAGRPRLGVSEAHGSTDDRGVYRLSRLVAGEYVVAVVRSESSTPLSVVEVQRRSAASGDQAAARALNQDLMTAGVPTSPPGSADVIRVGSNLYSIGSPKIAPRPDGLLVYPTQYFRSESQVASARTIAVRSGEDVGSIDFTIRPVLSYRVSGRVVDASGPMAHFPVRLAPAGNQIFAMDQSAPAVETVTDDAGRFTFLGVLPGDHVLRALKGSGGGIGEAGVVFIEAAVVGGASGTVISTSPAEFPLQPSGPPAPTLFATRPVTVADRHVDDVTVTVKNGARLIGRLEFAGARDKPAEEQLARLHVVAEGHDGRIVGFAFEMTGPVQANGRFETVELPPGRYFLRMARAPEGWTIGAVTVQARDVSSLGIEVGETPVDGIVIRLTDQPAGLGGTVQVTGTDTPEHATVIAFPVDRAAWVDYGATPRRLGQAAVARDGAFAVNDLPPGEYFIAALRDDFVSDWRDPAFLERVARIASRARVDAGRVGRVTLSMVTLR